MAAPVRPGRRRRQRASLEVVGMRAVEVFRAEEEAGGALEEAGQAAAAA